MNKYYRHLVPSLCNFARNNKTIAVRCWNHYQLKVSNIFYQVCRKNFNTLFHSFFKIVTKSFVLDHFIVLVVLWIVSYIYDGVFIVRMWLELCWICSVDSTSYRIGRARVWPKEWCWMLKWGLSLRSIKSYLYLTKESHHSSLLLG